MLFLYFMLMLCLVFVTLFPLWTVTLPVLAIILVTLYSEKE